MPVLHHHLIGPQRREHGACTAAPVFTSNAPKCSVHSMMSSSRMPSARLAAPCVHSLSVTKTRHQCCRRRGRCSPPRSSSRNCPRPPRSGKPSQVQTWADFSSGRADRPAASRPIEKHSPRSIVKQPSFATPNYLRRGASFPFSFSPNGGWSAGRRQGLARPHTSLARARFSASTAESCYSGSAAFGTRGPSDVGPSASRRHRDRCIGRRIRLDQRIRGLYSYITDDVKCTRRKAADALPRSTQPCEMNLVTR